MTHSVSPREVFVYTTKEGRQPYSDWLNGLRDGMTRRRIIQRVTRLESGNYGDCKSLKDGVFELRLAFGSGYRIYFAEDGNTFVILLCGGDKSTQEKDIEGAKAYWKEYKNDKT